MRHLIVLLLGTTLVAGVLGATQIQKGSYGSPKQRKPSLPKKYLVEDGGYLKQRKVRAVLSQYELRDRHRLGRQLPGVRNGGYLYNRPVYTSSDHLAARPALPLTEVESHPLSNFPAHYTGDLEDDAKDEKAKTTAAADGDKPMTPTSNNTTAKDTATSESEPKNDPKTEPMKPSTAEAGKQVEMSQEKKSENAPVAVPASAVVPVGKNLHEDQTPQDLDKAAGDDSKLDTESAMKSAPAVPQETVAGKPPAAAE